MMCKFSVVIPLFNKENYITRAIQSVLSQTIANFELIIIDDGSTDTSVTKVENFYDSRIRLISQSHQGVSIARNRGIEESQSQYVLFLDADDEWYHNHLAQIDCLIKTFPNAAMFASNYELRISKNKSIQSDLPLLIPKNPRDQVQIINSFFHWCSTGDCPVNSSNVAIDKRVFQTVGVFNNNATYAEDLDLWFRIAEEHQIAFHENVAVLIHKEANSRSSRYYSHTQDSAMPVVQTLISIQTTHPEFSLHTSKILNKIFRRLSISAIWLGNKDSIRYWAKKIIPCDYKEHIIQLLLITVSYLPKIFIKILLFVVHIIHRLGIQY